MKSLGATSFRSFFSLPFRCAPLIALHSNMLFGLSSVMYEWLAGLREMVIDSERCPLTFAKFTLKEYMRALLAMSG